MNENLLNNTQIKPIRMEVDDCPFIPVDQDPNNNATKKVPEGIGNAEDSGFANIARLNENCKSNNLICDDSVKFCSFPEDLDSGITSFGMINPAERRRNEEIEARRQANEEFNRVRQEQIYKRLKHLVSKSKFYSDYIMNKVNNTNKENVDIKKGNNGKRPKQKVQSRFEDNAPLSKRPRRIPSAHPKYDLKDYVTDDIKKTAQKKMNLSEEDVEKQLSVDSDNENELEKIEVEEKEIILKYFKGELRDYQKEGLKWLKVLYDKGLNGILGDEMGLGKTIQVIAFICYLIEQEQAGPFLIIAPLSTIPNWMMEFERFAPELPVFLLHGNKESRGKIIKKISRRSALPDGYRTLPIVLTTFEVPLQDGPHLRKFKWRCLVIDEGHRIKNHESQLSQVVRSLHSFSRLILTGTPLQNNLAELWSLLNFLLPDIFDNLDVFESWFDVKELQNEEGTRKFLEQEKDKQIIASLREILKPFMLRREKADVCTDIPPKKEIIVYAPITELQRDLYLAVLNRDFENLRMKVIEPPIIETSDGRRPKRRCTANVDYTKYLFGSHHNDEPRPESSSMSSSLLSTTIINNDDATLPVLTQSKAQEKILTQWQKFANINERNQNFLIRIEGTNRLPMYKQIINHPYLIHCPLDQFGLPDISENLVKTSGKLLVLDAMLKKLYEQGHKVLLFSTMTMILDIIADYLSLRPWNFVKLDGRVGIEDRKVDIHNFTTDPGIFLFLISTRAGGVGLNLMAADTVIMFDSDWNPQADIQAMARCHRIGQTRPVVIYRLCTKGTIDEAIFQRAEAKRKLEKMVISKEMEGLNVNKAETILELKKLLESNDHHVVRSANDVFTDEELDKLLDRSDLLAQTEKTT